MRVNISYGVEFDELPDILDQLINKCLDDATTVKLKIQYLKHLVHDEEEDKVQVAKQIEAARQTLTRLDDRLADLSNLAVGYVDAKVQIKNSAAQTSAIATEKSVNSKDSRWDEDIKGPDEPPRPLARTQKVIKPKYEETGEVSNDLELSV